MSEKLQHDALKLLEEFVADYIDPYIEDLDDWGYPKDDKGPHCMFCGQHHPNHKESCVWLRAFELVCLENGGMNNEK